MSGRIPLVAIVGRPNVGKSTLFNRFVGRRMAIVDDQAGVTRDRLFGEARCGGRVFRIVDTGGIEIDSSDTLLAGVRQQTQAAIDEADLVLFLLDSASGLTPPDEEVAQLLRRAGKPTLAAANKVDCPQHEARVAELYALGFDHILPVSAEHANGFSDLVDAIIERLNPPEIVDIDAQEAPLPVWPEEANAHEVADGRVDHESDRDAGAVEGGEEAEAEAEVAEPSRIEWQGGPIRVAVVGRPNVGKSSIINRLLGEERHLASAIPGTTRDSIDSELEHNGQRYVFTDTAGIRRKRSIFERLEKFAVMMSMRSLDGADVALVLLDASEPPSDQDARIISMAQERGKGVILVANKWDLCRGADVSKEFFESIERQLGFASHAPVLRVSAKTGRGVGQLLDTIVEVQRERHRRITTGELNRFFREVVTDSPPPVRSGRKPKLFFVSQPLVRPPTFVFTASHADDIRDSYKRYLTNSLRKRYGFGGTPLWVKFRGR